MAKSKNISKFPDLDLGALGVKDNDSLALKFLMLIEGTYGQGVQHAIKKYGYTEQRFYQVKKDLDRFGLEGLINKKRGPKNNSLRTESLVKRIITHRFLDPDASAAVIAQKLEQKGFSISVRSVERTIQEYGLQKKTLPIKSKYPPKGNKDSPNKKNRKKRSSNSTNQ